MAALAAIIQTVEELLQLGAVLFNDDEVLRGGRVGCGEGMFGR